jgi:hypothetical protein
VGVSYENVDQAKYENIEQQQQQQHEAEMTAQSNYENLDQPSYENIDEGGASVADVGGENDTIDVDGGETYENVVLRDTAESSRNVKEQQPQQYHLPLSVSLPSLLNTNNKMASQKLQTSSSLAAPPHVNTSLPPTPTPLYELHPESKSVSSKRRFESEIGRDLLRDRRIRNEIENSRRS